MADAATWISSLSTFGAALASAVAAWQSFKSSKASADEARQMRDQAEVSRKQVAVERMLLAAESLSADRIRAAVLARDIKQGSSAVMFASGARQASSTDTSYTQADKWEKEVVDLSAVAIRATSWGPADLDAMSHESVEAVRVEMLRARERVAAALEHMEREREDWSRAFDRLTRVTPPGG